MHTTSKDLFWWIPIYSYWEWANNQFNIDMTWPTFLLYVSLNVEVNLVVWHRLFWFWNPSSDISREIYHFKEDVQNYPDQTFHNFRYQFQYLTITISDLSKIWSADFDALKLWNVRRPDRCFLPWWQRWALAWCSWSPWVSWIPWTLPSWPSACSWGAAPASSRPPSLSGTAGCSGSPGTRRGSGARTRRGTWNEEETEDWW